MKLNTKKTRPGLLVFLSSLLVLCFPVMGQFRATDIFPELNVLSMVEGKDVWIPSYLDAVMLSEDPGTDYKGDGYVVESLAGSHASKRGRETEGLWGPMGKRARQTEGMWRPMKKRGRETVGTWRPMKRGRETVGMWRPMKKRGRETVGMWRPMKRGRETEGMWVPMGKRGRETEGLWGPMGKRLKERLKETDGLQNFYRIVRAFRNPWNRVYKRDVDWVFRGGWDPTRGKRNECGQCMEPETDYMVYPGFETRGIQRYRWRSKRREMMRG